MMKSIQRSILFAMGAGASLVLCAQQRTPTADAQRLNRTYAQERYELLEAKADSRRENRYVVREAAVVELEARREYALMRPENEEASETGVDPRSPEGRAQMEELLSDYNAHLPMINASLKKSFSNSPLAQIELKPLKVDELLTSVAVSNQTGRAFSDQESLNQALNQAVYQHLQEEIMRIDPQAWKQIQAVLNAAQEEESELPQQHHPRQMKQQVSPKGAP